MEGKHGLCPSLSFPFPFTFPSFPFPFPFPFPLYLFKVREILYFYILNLRLITLYQFSKLTVESSG